MQKYLGGALALIVSVAVGGTHVASAQSSVQGPSVEQSSGGLEEIVVTAERRRENLQDVPISVTAVTAAGLLNQGITDTAGLAQAVPGLQFDQQANGATPFIRGVGTTNGGTGNESSVALYIDDVYISSVNASLFDLSNINQVEVLKGPQGTLFGRNATGGVIQITTKDPSQTSSGQVDVGYANFGTSTASFYGTTGLTHTLAANVAGYYLDRSRGWGTDLTTGEPTYKDIELGARTKLLWTPGDDTRVTLAFDYNKSRDDVGLQFHVLPGAVGPDGATRYSGFYNTYVDPLDRSNVRQLGVSVKLEQDFDILRLVSITSWRNLSGFFNIDQDATPAPIVEAPIVQHDRTFTEEVHLLSKPAAALPWIAGVYYFNDRSAYDPLAIEGLAASPLDALQIYSHQGSKSYAAFGQLTPQLGHGTELAVGIRYTRDERNVQGATFGQIGGATIPLATPPEATATWSKPTWRVALDHKFSTDLMAYVSYDRGFKSGVFNLLTYAAPPVNPEILDAYQIGMKSELLDRRLRLNASAFYYNYKNIQVEEIIAGSTIAINAAAAHMKGIDLDIEYAPFDQLTIRAGAEYLNAHYTDFKDAPFNTPAVNAAGLPTGGNIGGSGDATGFDTVHSPKFTFNVSPDYRLSLPMGRIDLVMSYYHNSGFAWDPDNRVRQSAYGLLAASAAWTSPSDLLTLRLWGKNLTGAEYCSYAAASTLTDFCSAAAPRTFGATLTARF